MKKYVKKLLAFTLTEAIITMLILGIIIALATPGILLPFNPSEKGWITLSQKMAENIEQATIEILLFHSSYDNFLRIKDGNGYFSIEDNNVTQRISDLYKKYLSNVDLNVNLNNEYFSKNILDYNRSSTGTKLKDAYSNFFYVNDGMLIGFRFYGSCNTIERNSNPPDHRGRFDIMDICGSIFYDINSFKKPNKLGSDQYILPVYKRGIKYNND